MSKSRYPEIKEKGKCRGCGAPVPEGRKTWCSNKCWEPHTVIGRHRVLRRDKVCQICGLDILGAINRHQQEMHAWWEGGCKGPRPVDEPDYQIDHIIPVVEGGKTTYENLRLLCTPCHKKRTAEWHKQKVSERRQAKVGPDLFDLAKK